MRMIKTCICDTLGVILSLDFLSKEAQASLSYGATMLGKKKYIFFLLEGGGVKK